MEDLCHFQIASLSFSFYSFSIQSGVFSTFQFIRDTMLFHLTIFDFTANIQEEKTIFKMAKIILRSNIFNGK